MLKPSLPVLSPMPSKRQPRPSHKLKETAKELTAKEKVRKDAEAESARLITDAQQKADQIIHEAEQTATKLIDKAKIEAGEKWVSIVNQATESANRLMRLTKAAHQTEQGSKQKQRKRSGTQK